MPRDMQPIADMLLLAIKAALAPVQADLSAMKQKNADLQARIEELSGLRDRVTAVETKADRPLPQMPDPPDPIDPGPAIALAMAPVLAELAAFTTRNNELSTQLKEFSERVVAIETTRSVERAVTGAQDPVPSLAEIELSLVTKHLGPLQERVARIDERERIVVPAPVVEPPPVIPPGPTLADLELAVITKHVGPLTERVARLEERERAVPAAVTPPPEVVVPSAAELELQMTKTIAPLAERLVRLEERERNSPPPTTDQPMLPSLAELELTLAKHVAPLAERVVRLEERNATPVDQPVLPSSAELELTLAKQVAPLRERLARIEERAQVPGPPGLDGKDGAPGQDGKDGKDGRDGVDGKDGADGLGFDDFDVQYDGDRTIEIKMQRGDRVKSWPITLPFQKQQGVFVQGKSYRPGDLVTWGGSQWHCNEATTDKPGEGSKAWTLVVKRGRDGKDGKDAPSLPVVKTPTPVVKT